MSEIKGVLAKELAEQLGGSQQRYRILFEEGQIPGFRGEGKKSRVYFDPSEVAKSVADNGIVIQGYRGPPPEPTEAEKHVEKCETGAFRAAREASLKYFRTELELAEQEGRWQIEAALHRRIADLLEEMHGVEGQGDA